MALHRLIAVEDQDPLNSVRATLDALWEQAAWDGLLTPVWHDPPEPPKPTLLTSRSDLARADPFAPIMLHNAASLAAQTIENNPTNHLAILLRPCEYRSLLSIAGKRRLNLNQHLFIGTDCLGTYPEEEFHNRALQEKDPEMLTCETLLSAAQKGTILERFRFCCHVCTHFTINNADIQIFVIGLDTNQHFILGITEETNQETLNIESLSTREVTPGLLERRAHAMARIARWRQQALDYASSRLSDQYKSISGLKDHLNSCSECRDRVVQHCPQFQARWLGGPNGQELAMLEAWLRSCGGCGMCAHDCPQGYPLFESILFLMAKCRRQML